MTEDFEEDTEEDIRRKIREERELKGKVFGVELKKPKDEKEGCILEEQVERFKEMITEKQKLLEEELLTEKKHYDKYGLFNNRDVEEVESDLKIVKNVLNNMDKIPRCKP